MDTGQHWSAGDEYWSLWIRGESGAYFAVFEGRVNATDGAVLRLSNGSWRFADEGMAFTSKADAEAFIASASSHGGIGALELDHVPSAG